MKIKIKDHQLDLKKIGVYLLITLIVLLSLSVTALKVYFDSQRLKKLVLPYLERRTGREINIERINLSLWPQFGIKLVGVEVANPSGFTQQNLAHLDSFTFSVKLLPLLEEKIEIDDLILTGLELDLIKKEDGANNYQLATASKETKDNNQKRKRGNQKAQTSDSTKPSFSLNLENIRINEGEITYNDLSQKGSYKIKGINSSNKLEFSGNNNKVMTTGELNISELSLAANRFSQFDDKLKFSLTHQLNFDLQKNILKAEQFDFKFNEFELNNSFQVDLLKNGFAVKNLISSNQNSTLEIADLSKEGTKLYFSLQGKLDLEQILTDLPVQSDYDLRGIFAPDLMGQFDIESLNNDLASLELLGEIKLSDLALKSKKLPLDLKETGAMIKISPQKFDIKSLQTRLLASNFSGSVVVEKWRPLIEALMAKESNLPGQINLSLAVNRLDLNKWQQKFGTTQSESEDKKESRLAKEKNSQKSLKRVIPDLALIGDIAIGELDYQELKAKDIVAEFKTVDDLIKLLKLKLNAAEGELKGRGRLSLKDSTPNYSGNLTLEKMNVNQLLTTFTKFNDTLYGGLDLDLDFKGDSIRSKELLNSLTLQGDFAVKETRVGGTKILRQLNNYFAVIDRSDLKLGKLKGEIKLEEGKLKFDEVKSFSAGDQLQLDGYTSLGGKLDFKVEYLLSAQKSKELDLAGKELLYAPNTKRVKVFLNLTGSTTKPKVEWDRSRLEEKMKEGAEDKIKEKAKKEKEEAKEKIKEELEEKKDEVKDKIKDLF